MNRVILALLLVALVLATGAVAAEPQALKQAALQDVQAWPPTGDTSVDKKLAALADDLQASLADSQGDLFLSGTEIVPPARGKQVFQAEAQAVQTCEWIVAKTADPGLQALVTRIRADLAAADRALAEAALAEALLGVPSASVHFLRFFGSPRTEREVEGSGLAARRDGGPT
jgi:hypothetical protein